MIRRTCFSVMAFALLISVAEVNMEHVVAQPSLTNNEQTEHWSFLPIQGKPLPKLVQDVDASWPRNGIDFWVLSEMKKNGLRPMPQAPRRILIRRVKLDLCVALNVEKLVTARWLNELYSRRFPQKSVSHTPFGWFLTCSRRTGQHQWVRYAHLRFRWWMPECRFAATYQA